MYALLLWEKVQSCVQGGVLPVPKSKKAILICTKCLSRNYTVAKNSQTNTTRLEVKKYCRKCNQHVLHKESR